jgi:hypothetical protein
MAEADSNLSKPMSRHAAGSDLNISRITSENEFLALRREWNELLSVSCSDRVCLTWEWLWTWWAVFGRGRELALLSVRNREGGIDAIAPFSIRATADGMAPLVRKLEMLGSGEPPNDAIWSEYLDLIVRRGREKQSVAAIAEHLTLCPDWDEIHFSNTLDGSLASMLGGVLSAGGFRLSKISKAPSLTLNLPREPEDVVRLLHPPTKRKLHAYLRKGEAAGGFNLEVCQSETELVEWFDQLISLHRQRWAACGQAGVFASENFRTFHQTIAPLFFSQGKLALFRLSFKDRVVAIMYGFRHGRTLSAYQCGFDLQAAPKMSLGLIMYAFCLQEAVRSGMAEWDFLRGEESYKTLWPVVRRPYADIRVWRTGARATAARYAFLAPHHARALIRKCLLFLRMRRRQPPPQLPGTSVNTRDYWNEREDAS